LISLLLDWLALIGIAGRMEEWNSWYTGWPAFLLVLRVITLRMSLFYRRSSKSDIEREPSGTGLSYF
jgi:hypothetical protein